MNNTGVTPKNDFEHARGLRNSAYAVNLTYDRHTDIHIYILREISIEHPSVGLASLAQLGCTDLTSTLGYLQQILEEYWYRIG